MQKKKAAPTSTWIDPDDAPEVTAEMLARGTLSIGGMVIRRGRPALAEPTINVTLRMEPALHEELRGLGRGWQAQATAALRELVRAKVQGK